MNENIESFSPTESNEGVDAAALEQLREKMKAARAQMRKDQQEERKQKKQEDSLFEVLYALVKQLGPKDQRVQLVSACLSKNLPAETILAILALEFNTIQKLLGLEFLTAKNNISGQQEQALIVTNLGHQNLPLHIRYNIDTWVKNVNKTVFEKPIRNKNAIENPANPNQANDAFKKLLSYVAQSYLQKEKIEFNPQNVINFISVFANNLSERLHKQTQTAQIESQPQQT